MAKAGNSASSSVIYGSLYQSLQSSHSTYYFALSNSSQVSVKYFYRHLKVSETNLDFESFKPVLAQCYISYRNLSFGLQCKSNNWFLYEMQHSADVYEYILHI